MSIGEGARERAAWVGRLGLLAAGAAVACCSPSSAEMLPTSKGRFDAALAVFRTECLAPLLSNFRAFEPKDIEAGELTVSSTAAKCEVSLPRSEGAAASALLGTAELRLASELRTRGFRKVVHESASPGLRGPAPWDLEEVTFARRDGELCRIVVATISRPGLLVLIAGAGPATDLPLLCPSS